MTSRVGATPVLPIVFKNNHFEFSLLKQDKEKKKGRWRERRVVSLKKNKFKISKLL